MNIERAEDFIYEVSEDSKYINELVEEIVKQCCENLDNYVNDIKDKLTSQNYNMTDKELDDIVMTIPTLIYFASEVQERLGIRYDIAKSNKTQIFNDIFINKDGNQGLKKAVAENKTFNESMIVCVYDRSYNIIKSKISAAMEILQSAKKIISRRMQSIEFTRLQPNKEKD